MTQLILLTGAAGFIGSRIAQSLAAAQKEGRIRLISVDARDHFKKRKEHQGIDFGKIIDRSELMDWLRNAEPQLSAILHIGACSSTMELNVAYLKRTNIEYSQQLWNYASSKKIPFIYASSAATYGAGENGYVDLESLIPQLHPLNPYGDSKQIFDLWALEQERLGNHPPAWSGFKFFNVYGFGERHKNRMASVVMHSFDQIRSRGYVELFRSHKEGIADGEQKRDFIFIDDVVSALHFAWQTPIQRGIYNLGSGKARSFLDLARATFKAMNIAEDIRFIDTPEALRARYQYFTEASMEKLRAANYNEPFLSLEEGVSRYVQELQQSHFHID